MMQRNMKLGKAYWCWSSTLPPELAILEGAKEYQNRYKCSACKVFCHPASMLAITNTPVGIEVDFDSTLSIYQYAYEVPKNDN